MRTNRPIRLFLVLIVCAASAPARSSPPDALGEKDVAVAVTGPLKRSKEATDELVTLLERVRRAENEKMLVRARFEEDHDSAKFEKAWEEEKELRRKHVRELVSAAKAHSGTTAALSAKLVVSISLGWHDGLQAVARKLWKEIQDEQPGTWQAQVARLMEITDASHPERPDARSLSKCQERAWKLATDSLPQFSKELEIPAEERRVLDLLGFEAPLRAYCLLFMAEHRYQSAIFDFARGPGKAAAFAEARAAFVQLKTEYPKEDKLAKDADQMISLIDSLATEREGK